MHLIPDIEGLAFPWRFSVYSVRVAESRPGEFSDTLKSAFNAIAAVKKQLAMFGKIPPIVFATDFNNNHGYTQAAQKIDLNIGKQAQELPTAADIVQRLPVETGGTDPAELPDDLENL